jgi:Dolichyl-phosphate-mannose-protein mannosyltransferase
MGSHGRLLASAGAVLGIALLLRAMHWPDGLPWFLEEAQPLRQALRMWRADGTIGWNPHYFIYPSLTIYFHLGLQWLQVHLETALGTCAGVPDYLLGFEIDPTAHVLFARAVVTIVDLATVLGTIVIGERLARGAGIAAGLVVALSPTCIETSLALYVEAHLAVFTVWSLERMLAYARRSNSGALAAAGFLAGLAASSKYPGVLLCIPLVWVAATASGIALADRFRHAITTLAMMAAGFALTSPFVLLDWRSAVNDLQFAAVLASQGHLGHLQQRAAGFYWAQLARDPGILVLLLGALMLVLHWKNLSARRDSFLLVLTALPLLAGISLSSVIAPRYVVSILPVLAIGAAVAAMRLAAMIPRLALSRGAILAGVVVVASNLLATWGMLARPALDTRLAALSWCADSLPPAALVIRENGGPPLLSEQRQQRLEEGPLFRRASETSRARYMARRSYNDIAWPLFVHGNLGVNLVPQDAQPRWVQVIPQAVDFTAAFYDLRLLAYADYVITSNTVRSRFEADPVRFAVEVSAYHALDRDASMVARFAPGPTRHGPDIRIYRISAMTRALWLSEYGVLTPGWWLSRVPPDAAIRRELLADARLSQGGSPVWARPLADFHARYVGPTLSSLAHGLIRAGRPEDAARIARLNAAWQ